VGDHAESVILILQLAERKVNELCSLFVEFEGVISNRVQVQLEDLRLAPCENICFPILTHLCGTSCVILMFCWLYKKSNGLYSVFVEFEAKKLEVVEPRF
jgi:hypothetical protein